MNTRKGILGLLLMALLPLSAQTAERGLKECIRMGIERNLSLKNARIGIETGRTTVSQARANLLPQVNGTLQAGDYLKRPVNVTTSTLLGADFPDAPTWGKVRSMPLTAQGAGNFVKIQQRVPVRIDFEGLTDEDNQRLAAGMMCEIKVKVKSEE